MNPMQMLQGMRNPQQFLQQMMGNNSVMSNPMARNAMQMAQKGDSAADKDAKMKELEKYMKSLSEDVTELFSGMSPEEKQLTKTKLTTLVTKM